MVILLISLLLKFIFQKAKVIRIKKFLVNREYGIFLNGKGFKSLLSKIASSPQSHRGHREIIFIWREVPPNKKSSVSSKQRSYSVSEPRKVSAILFPKGGNL